MQTDLAVGLVALFVAACGGATVAGVATDASSDGDDDAGVVGDGGPLDDGSFFGDGSTGFEGGTADALAAARDQCDPPCHDGEYCYASITRGGGRINNRNNRAPVDGGDGGDASIGCHPFPAQCAPSATCACLLQVVGPACHGSVTDCIVDDAGRPTVECIVDLP